MEVVGVFVCYNVENVLVAHFQEAQGPILGDYSVAFGREIGRADCCQ